MMITIKVVDDPSERLRAVADLFEAHPKVWDQSYWSEVAVSDESDFGGLMRTVEGHSCGTAGCIAGWAVASLAEDQAAEYLFHLDFDEPWMQAGAEALGLSAPLANTIFCESFPDYVESENFSITFDSRGERVDFVVGFLRKLSYIPVDERLDADRCSQIFMEALPGAFSLDKWRAEVQGGETVLGFIDWLQSKEEDYA
jgi:hypothetical protein